MRFWDASAIVPLLVAEPSTRAALDLLEEDPVVLAWWGTPVECISALARREREGALDPQQVTAALARLGALATSWNEVVASDRVRTAAQRVLRVHPLRAPDALQLAAALVASDHEPPTLEMVCLDERLGAAAAREGFVVRS